MSAPDERPPKPSDETVLSPSQDETLALTARPRKRLGEPTPGQRIGDFEVISKLGEGGMGAVYKARQLSLKRVVALKLLPPRFVDNHELRIRFRREVELAGRLRHPHIVGVYEAGEVDGAPYYAMPLIDGQPLNEALQAGPWEPRAAARLVAKLARAVDAAHAAGVLHRDLKPANVILDGAGEPLITDFGLAKELDASLALTQAGDVVGTPAYMAPEQAEGAPHCDHRVDIYALGAILYELLTGAPAFTGSSAQAIIVKVLAAPPEPLRARRPEVPRELERLCLATLEKEPEDRPPTALDLAEDLERAAAGQPLRLHRPSLLDRALRWTRRHKLRALAGAALLALLLGAVALTAYGARAQEARRLQREALEHLRAGRIDEARQLTEVAFELRPEMPAIRAARAEVARILGDAALADQRPEAAREEYARAEALTGVGGLIPIVFVAGAPKLEALVLEAPFPELCGPLDLRGGRAERALAVGAYILELRVAGDAYRQPLRLSRDGPRRQTLTPPASVPAGMVYIPATELWLGDPTGDADEAPRRVRIAAFAIDREEVTVEAYEAFLAACEAGELSLPAGLTPRPESWESQRAHPRRPVVGLSQPAAAAYAAFAGKRLPTEEEWELAAGGIDGRRYPWGAAFELGAANLHRAPAEVGAFPRDLSPFGALDMAGNALEWTASPAALPCGETGAVIRGGGWLIARAEAGRIRDRWVARREATFPDVGLRCAHDLGGPPPETLERAPPARPALSPELRIGCCAGALSPALVAPAALVEAPDLAALRALAPELDLLLVPASLAPSLIAEGLARPIPDPEALEADLSPAFRRLPWLCDGPRCYGLAAGARSPGRAAIGRDPGGWEELWGERAALYDDACWAAWLAAARLGLEDGTEAAALAAIEAELRRLLGSGCKLWREPEALEAWLRGGEVEVWDDWGQPAERLLREAPELDLRRSAGSSVSTRRVDAWMLGGRAGGRAALPALLAPGVPLWRHARRGVAPLSLGALRVLERGEALRLSAALPWDDRPEPTRRPALLWSEALEAMWTRVKDER